MDQVSASQVSGTNTSQWTPEILRRLGQRAFKPMRSPLPLVSETNTTEESSGIKLT